MKKGKKRLKILIKRINKSKKLFFHSKRGVFDHKLREEFKKHSPDALQILFFGGKLSLVLRIYEFCIHYDCSQMHQSKTILLSLYTS